MERSIHILAVSAWLAGCMPGWAGQVPGAASDPDIPISHRDRVYSAEQFSNTVSVTDPVDNSCSALFGSVIRCRPISVRFTAVSCWCMALDSRQIIGPSRWSPSARTP